MDFSFTKEQLMLLDSLRDMGKRENFKELAVEIDKTRVIPTELVKNYAKMGLLGMTLPSKYGGGDEDSMTAILAIEELAKFSPMIAANVFESNVGAVRVIDMYGSEEQKKAIIPGVCSGEYSVSVCMTEPEAGSDLTALSTFVEDKGDHYQLNGRKCFITGGGEASHYLVYTRIGDSEGDIGIGGILLGERTPGFTLRTQGDFM